MDSTSSFSEEQGKFPDAELLPVSGTTCLCYRVKLYGKLHFLKRLKPELRTHPQYAAAFQKEFELGYPLDHPHLVRYVAKTDDGILMDYVDGKTLSTFIEHHPDYFRNKENADRFIDQLLSAVGYLHSHQIIHLDLKPSNILITRIGHDVKLIDLGYSYADCYTDTKGRTDKYAAPEQLNGSEKVDVRTDIYAIGRILQTLPCAHNYNKVIKRCTAQKMDDRYSSIEELQKAIQRRHRSFWPFLAILVLILAILAAYLFLPQKHSEPALPEQSSPKYLPEPEKESTITLPQTDSLKAHENPSPSNTQEDLKETLPVVTQTVTPVDTISATPPSSQDTKTIQKEDTLALRRELQQVIGARFQKALGQYSDSIYYKIDQSSYTYNWIVFSEEIRPLYEEEWQKFRGTYREETIDSEWCQTLLYFRITQLWQMMRNDPNHDPFYDTKEFKYYEIPCPGT